MASTFSTNLRLELIGTGDQSGTWGSTTNTNLGTLLEQAISGVAAVSMTSDADYTLTTANGATDQARQAVLSVTSTVSLTATRNVIVPTVNKTYIVKNGTTGGQSIVVKTSAGTGITVTNGSTTAVYCDGTNIVSALNYLPTINYTTAVGVTSETVPLVIGGTAASSTLTLESTSGVGTSDAILFKTGSQNERMRIDSSGNVGIGTTSPSTYVKLAVSGNVYAGDTTPNTDGTITIGSSGAGSVAITRTGMGATNSAMTFSTTFATLQERMRIDSSGNLLVGTTSASNSPTQGITLSPNATIGNLGIGHALGTTTGNTYAQFAYNGTAIGTITQSGTTAVLYNVTSDQRLKTNIIDAPSALSIIDAIQIRSFDWKADNSHNRYGVIAQELNQLVPEAVHTPIAENDMMGVDYSKLVPILIKSFQELKAEFDAYKASHA